MTTHIFKEENPIDKLYYTNLETEEQKSEFCSDKLFNPNLQLIDDGEYREEIGQAYPEDRPSVYNRIVNLTDNLRQSYMENPVRQKTAHLIITHGVNVLSFTKYVTSLSPDGNHVKPKNFMNYTATAGALISGNSFRLTMDGSTHWLKDNSAQNDLIQRHRESPEAVFAVKAAKIFSLDCKFQESVGKIERGTSIQSMTPQQEIGLLGIFK